MFTHSLRQASFDFALLRSGQALTIPPLTLALSLVGEREPSSFPSPL